MFYEYENYGSMKQEIRNRKSEIRNQNFQFSFISNISQCSQLEMLATGLNVPLKKISLKAILVPRKMSEFLKGSKTSLQKNP